jgi:uncharacterized protein
MTLRNTAACWPIYIFIAVTLALTGARPHAASTEWTPRLQDRVTDLAHALSTEDRERLTRVLVSYERETFHQLGVLIVPTLSGERIESLALRVANQAALGHKGIDNGILVVLAMKERSIRIELGRGMERHITNDTAKAIIKGVMVPAFRRGDFAGGLTSGLELLMREARKFVVRPDELPLRSRK